mmetsp:Transcript_40150/g.110561  ORF Transcript_40150/g.110561 Transcript_40150/m.110561 type:complete len:245 (+) Transcript_40150:878-1612(+)
MLDPSTPSTFTCEAGHRTREACGSKTDENHWAPRAATPGANRVERRRPSRGRRPPAQRAPRQPARLHSRGPGRPRGGRVARPPPARRGAGATARGCTVRARRRASPPPQTTRATRGPCRADRSRASSQPSSSRRGGRRPPPSCTPASRRRGPFRSPSPRTRTCPARPRARAQRPAPGARARRRRRLRCRRRRAAGQSLPCTAPPARRLRQPSPQRAPRPSGESNRPHRGTRHPAATPRRQRRAA